MRKLALIILDGWGIGELKPNNAIHMAHTPFFDSIWNKYPHTILQASGEFVGLPEGQIGGSEVGHLTIGAGRVIYQSLPRISKSLTHAESATGAFHIENFKKFLEKAKRHTPHLIGLISTGGVHSHQDHLFRLLELMKEYGCKPPVIHFISDGRDTPPTSSIKSAQALIKKMQAMRFGTIATLTGRFFAMDRDMNLDRTKKAADLFLHGTSAQPAPVTTDSFTNLSDALSNSHKAAITDEFVEPVLIDPQYKGIHPSDILFFWNFRSDRMKQIITMLHERLPQTPFFTLTRYDKSYSYPVIFEKETVDKTIGEVLSELNLTQLRATETEKAPHVTYFFNGGVEMTFAGERRAVAESHKVKHDQIPHMKTAEIHQNIRREVLKDKPDFILVNFANPDMVGHTGNFKAVVAGVEKVDQELKELTTFLTQQGYICAITADHGNADIMYDLATGEPHTAHTLNPVPFIIYDLHDTKNQHLKLDQDPHNGLSLIAGTALDLMGITKKHDHFSSLIR